jgi:hypothetical protein
LGVTLTLAVSLIGMRKTFRRDLAWFTGLVMGAPVPLVATAPLAGIAVTGDDLNAQSGLRVLGLPVWLTAAVALPLVAAIVTTAYAVRAARLPLGMRSSVTPAA